MYPAIGKSINLDGYFQWIIYCLYFVGSITPLKLKDDALCTFMLGESYE